MQEAMDTSESSSGITREDLKHLTAYDLSEQRTASGKTYCLFMLDYIVKHLNRGQVRRLAQRLCPEDTECHKILDSMRGEDKVSLYIAQVMNSWLQKTEPKQKWRDFIGLLAQHRNYNEYLIHLGRRVADRKIENESMDDFRDVSELVSNDEDFPVCNKEQVIVFATQVLGFSDPHARAAVDNVEIEPGLDTVHYGSKLLDNWRQRMVSDTALHLIESLESINFDKSHITEFTRFLLEEPAFMSIMQRKKEEFPDLG